MPTTTVALSGMKNYRILQAPSMISMRLSVSARRSLTFITTGAMQKLLRAIMRAQLLIMIGR